MSELITEFDFTLTEEEVLKGQGIDPQRASAKLYENAREVIEETHGLIKPAALYTIVDVIDYEHQKVTFDGGSFEGPLVAKALVGAENLNIAVCTIGGDLEKRVQGLMSENPIMGVALDGAGTAALRRVSQTVEDIISEKACEQDLSLGMRAQPGQEGWPIEQQRLVFSILPTEKIGVRLSDSCLMIPRKSVSFVIPRGKELDSTVAPCDFCSKRNRCEWRKEKQHR